MGMKLFVISVQYIVYNQSSPSSCQSKRHQCAERRLLHRSSILFLQSPDAKTLCSWNKR